MEVLKLAKKQGVDEESNDLSAETAAKNSSTGYGSSTNWTHLAEVSNGLCKFNPTSPKGKWIFLLQTVLLSFTPIAILLVQNAFMFNDMLIKKDLVLSKSRQVSQVRNLALLILDLQKERAAIALNTYIAVKTGQSQDMMPIFDKTDKTLNKIKWKKFGSDKIFTSKLRFQIKLDDYRELANKGNRTSTLQQDEIMDFYIMLTTKMLNNLEKDAGNAQSSNNWRLIMTYFNMLKIIESTSIGLVYGLQFYNVGQLDVRQMVTYVEQNALVNEYYRQAKEVIPEDVETIIDGLYEGEGFKIVRSSTEEILANELRVSDHQKGVEYFEGCTKFTDSLSRILDMLTQRIDELNDEDLYHSLLAQVWGCFLLVLVMLISPLLIVLARNAISTIQLFATSVEAKAVSMRRQQRKQKKLVYKMLPRPVVQKINSGEEICETFESASVYFSCVVGFKEITKTCSALEVIQFLNTLYSVMDERMGDFDVYKVETISDCYMVASGVPRKNGDRHAKEICNMAINLNAACGMVVRPDKKPNTIEMMAGIHTGAIVAGVVGTKMPRYCLFGDTINTASRMKSTSEAGKIQISVETNMMLEMLGGFVTSLRGTILVKGKGEMETYWLNGLDDRR